jgi:proline-specific peptidase
VTSTLTTEGYLPVPGGMVWYRKVGAAQGVPLLVLHGGPGAGSEYLEPLAELADERPVIFYDQLGCGRSERPGSPSLWRLDRFVTEVAMVRRMLGLGEVHLYGHSWGGWLAIEYLLGHQDGVLSVTLASTSASIPEHARELKALRDGLPEDIAAVLDREELDHPDYRAALVEFYQRHLCRLPMWPPQLDRAMTQAGDSAAYEALMGPNELVLTGSLRDWDRTAELPSITIPALVTAGRFDEISPNCAETLSRGLPRARLRIFERSAHMPHLEEPSSYLAEVRSFLTSVQHNRGGSE